MSEKEIEDMNRSTALLTKLTHKLNLILQGKHRDEKGRLISDSVRGLWQKVKDTS